MRAKKRLGVYAGSFDPLTVGHLWMIEQGVVLFEKLAVAIGINPEKRCAFPLEDRLNMLRASLRRFRNLAVTSFSNLYTTPFFAAKYEEQARHNLNQSIRTMKLW